MDVSAELKARHRQRATRLSVSIPADLAQWTREMAERNGVTISAVVELALSKAAATPADCMSPDSHDEMVDGENRSCGCR